MAKTVSQTQLSFVKRVKKELCAHYNSSMYSMTTLQSILEDRYDFNINKGTLSDLFDENSPNINYACLVTVCDFFSIDISKLLTPEVINPNVGVKSTLKKQNEPEEPDNIHPFIESVKAVNSMFSVLREDNYMGEYRGYINAPTKEDKLEEFNLSLYKTEDNVTHAKLERISGKATYTYIGVPYHSKAYQTIHIFMTDTKGKGEFYFLSFGFQKYRSTEGLLFRQGLAVTGASLRSGTIVSQNFILIGNEITEENEKYIPGLLKLPSKEYCISVDTAEQLAEEHPEVKKLLDKFSRLIEVSNKNVYVINEDVIMDTNRKNYPGEERAKALLLLKADATVPERSCYVADNKFSEFVRDEMIR